MKQFYPCLEKLVSESLSFLYPDKAESFSEYLFLEIPRNKDFGDIALALPLKIASLVAEPPLEIAKKIKQEINKLIFEDNPGIESINVIAPGFINFSLSVASLQELFMGLLTDGEEFFKGRLSGKKKVLLEFVSANPTGPLSIAHGRQAVVGDTLANILSFAGYQVNTEYYVNDEGTQIDLFVESVSERMKEIKGEPFCIPEKGYLGDDVKRVAEVILENGYTKDIDKNSLKIVLDKIKSDLKKINITFDSWRSQKDLSREGKIEEAVSFLKRKGFTYEEDDALWFKSSLFGDSKDRVLKRRDGTFTYFAADIAYHKEKLERGYDMLIDLWGPDHHGYIPRMKAVLSVLNEDIKDEVKQFLVIIVQLVSVKDRKMSKRKGTAVLLSELVDRVGSDAVRFYYLLRKNSSHLEFDIDKALAKNFDNPLYYIQYAYARICSIEKKHNCSVDFDIRALSEKEELDLLKDVLRFGSILDVAINKKEPYFLVDYLKEIASSLHKFYETHRVLLEDNPDLTQSRLTLIQGVRMVLGLGLKLLKVTAPNTM